MIDKNKQLLQDIIEEIFGELIFFEEINKFLSFLMMKNKEINLISRKLDEGTITKEHIYDCLDAWTYFKPYNSITDLGSGGGFPAILLAIIFPNKQITMVEKSPKKCKYLKEAVEFLNLKNCIIKNNLVSEVNINSDIVTARAFKSLDIILNLTNKYFKRKGKYLLYKGREETINKEIKKANLSFKFKYEIIKSAKKMQKERNLVYIYQ